MERRAVLRGLTVVAAAAACSPGRTLGTAGGSTPTTDPGADTASSSAPTSELTAAEPGEARSQDRPESLAERSAEPPAQGSVLTVVCRAGWDARPPSGAFRDHTLDRLTVHHTAVAHTDPDEGAARARQHQRYHQEAGFADLAYHHLIDRDGDVFEGRPVTAAGETFTDYDPAGHYLPCLEGDFDRQAPSEPQLAALVDLLAWAAGTYGIPPATIAGHRRYASTSCPGDALQALIDDGTIRRRVEARLAGGGVELRSTC